MKIAGKVALVTGGAGGIGRALALALRRAGAAVAVADVDAVGVAAVAGEVGGPAITADVGRREEVERMIAAAETACGPIDLLCSNAGVAFSDAPGWMATSQPDESWDRAWRINVMSHVWGARAVLPGMIERGGGHLLQTVSAAGLLHQIGDAVYSTTKHAALGFAEALAITHGDDGIGVSVLCPQAVRTGMFTGAEFEALAAAASADGVLAADEVASAAVEGLAEDRFLILPHPEVAEYARRKAADPGRWIGGMRKFRRRLFAAHPPAAGKSAEKGET